MNGGMQDWSLKLSRLIDHAAQWHGEQSIVTRNDDGSIDRTTWAATNDRARRLAGALQGLGIRSGDRVATIAWNGARHLEAWFGITGAGAITHTINPRLFDEDIRYICDDAGGRILFIDPQFVPLIERLVDSLPKIERIIVLGDRARVPPSRLDLLCHDDLIAGHDAIDWADVDEDDGAGLCYTSGTTGRPKGVLYSHRSNFLHAYAAASPDGFDISSRTTILPVVPMYHANAWGLPYVAAAVGAKLVFNGASFDPKTILDLIRAEGVTLAGAVPTIWRGVLDLARKDGEGFGKLEEVLCGGAPAPSALIDAYETDQKIRFTHAWGMTELSPIGTVCRPSAAVLALPVEEQRVIKRKQGRPLVGIELKLHDDAGNDVPQDGVSPGNLLVRGPWVVQRYFNAAADAVDAHGWFDTGDIATLDRYGYMQIVDRAKDVIKSGGEWISSVALEDAALSLEGIADAAAIGVAHPKWDERPMLILVLDAGASLTAASILEHLSGRMAKWSLPDEIRFADAIPRTATGKIDKIALRNQFSGPVSTAPDVSVV